MTQFTDPDGDDDTIRQMTAEMLTGLDDFMVNVNYHARYAKALSLAQKIVRESRG